MTNKELTPSVDSNDLKSVWAAIEELKKHLPERDPNLNPNQGTSINIRPVVEQTCSRGANGEAILSRLTWLQVLQQMSKSEELTHMNLPKALRDDRPSDAVFRAFANVRISKLQETEHKEFPVDLEDLIRLIGDSSVS
jgi:hypothetical protein